MSQLQATAPAIDDAPDRATRLNLYRSMTNVRLVEKRAYGRVAQYLPSQDRG